MKERELRIRVEKRTIDPRLTCICWLGAKPSMPPYWWYSGGPTVPAVTAATGCVLHEGAPP